MVLAMNFLHSKKKIAIWAGKNSFKHEAVTCRVEPSGIFIETVFPKIYATQTSSQFESGPPEWVGTLADPALKANRDFSAEQNPGSSAGVFWTLAFELKSLHPERKNPQTAVTKKVSSFFTHFLKT